VYCKFFIVTLFQLLSLFILDEVRDDNSSGGVGDVGAGVDSDAEE
jgi:hypothetical protein